MGKEIQKVCEYYRRSMGSCKDKWKGYDSFKPEGKETSALGCGFLCLFSDLMGSYFKLYCFGYIGNPLSLLFGHWDLGEVICETG